MNRFFYYVKCLGDGSWLSKPANAGVFKKDIREAAPLTEAEAKAYGYGTAIYPLVPVEDVYPHKQTAAEFEADWEAKHHTPFGGIAFDPQRRADDAGVGEDTPTNGERADRSKATLSLYYQLGRREEYDKKRVSLLRDLALDVDLTQEPEIPLADMLTDLMHYCHREGIEWGEALTNAVHNFQVESFGAQI
jgi:hypothetical protein